MAGVRPKLFDRRGQEICVRVDSYGGAVWVLAWPFFLRHRVVDVAGVPVLGDEFQAAMMGATIG